MGDMELSEARSAVNDMTTINSKAASEKRHLESAIHTMHAEIDDMLRGAKGSEDEDKKNQDSMSELANKLQMKIKTYKKQIEEAEEIAALNLAKYRKAQQELEETEDRNKMAEAQLA